MMYSYKKTYLNESPVTSLSHVPCVVPRYSREEPFTALNIEIRNQQNLIESLEQYVKGDLLEGANAYHCEKCNKKVSAIWCRCVNYSRRVRSIVGTRGEFHHGDLVLCFLHIFFFGHL